MTTGQETAKIFVAKIPSITSKEHIERVFQQYGPVLETKMLFHDDGAFRGCAFIKYETEYSARKALGLNGLNVFSEDSQEPLVVRAAVDKRTYQKKKAEIGGYRAQQDQTNTRQFTTGMSGVGMNYPGQLGSAFHYHGGGRTSFVRYPDISNGMTYWKHPYHQNQYSNYLDTTRLPPAHSNNSYMQHGHGQTTTMRPIGGKTPPRGQTTTTAHASYNQDVGCKYKHEHPNYHHHHVFGGNTTTRDHQQVHGHGHNISLPWKAGGEKEPSVITTQTPPSSSYYKNQIQEQMEKKIGGGGGDVKKNKNNNAVVGPSSAEVMIKNSEKEEMYSGAQDWQNRFLPHWPMEFAPALTDFTDEWTEFAKKLTEMDKILIAQMMMNHMTTMTNDMTTNMDPNNDHNPQASPSKFVPQSNSMHPLIPPPYSMHQFLSFLHASVQNQQHQQQQHHQQQQQQQQQQKQQQQEHLLGMVQSQPTTSAPPLHGAEQPIIPNTQTPTENDGMGTSLYDSSYGPQEEATTNTITTHATPQQQQYASGIASTTHYDGFLHHYPYIGSSSITPTHQFESSYMSHHPYSPGFMLSYDNNPLCSGEGEAAGEGGYRTPRSSMLIPSSMKMVDGAPLTASPPMARENTMFNNMYTHKGFGTQMMEYGHDNMSSSDPDDDMTSFSNEDDVGTPRSDNDNTSPRVGGSNSIEHASSLSVGESYRPYGVDREFASMIPCIIREYIDEYTDNKLHTRYL